MTHENETKIKYDDSIGSTLPFLIEQHKKEIWEWKQKEAGEDRVGAGVEAK